MMAKTFMSFNNLEIKMYVREHKRVSIKMKIMIAIGAGTHFNLMDMPQNNLSLGLETEEAVCIVPIALRLYNHLQKRKQLVGSLRKVKKKQYKKMIV